MLTRFSLTFQLRKSKSLQNGTVPIYLRVAITESVFELSSKQYIKQDKWNTEAQKVMGNSEEARTVNAYLKNLEKEVFQAYHELIQHNEEVTAINLKMKLLGQGINRRNILDVFKEHNQKVEALVGKQYADLTLERYKTSLSHTQNFILWKYKIADMDVTQLNYEFIESYEFWLKSVRNCDHNTTMKYLGNFKKIVRICIKNGWLQRDPFYGFNFAMHEVKRTALVEEELATLTQKTFVSDRVGRVRDIFLFSCYTGLAYVDVKKLRRAEIQKGNNNQEWIFTSRQKTDTDSRIPLLPEASAILKKYENDPVCVTSDRALPVLSNQKMNSYLASDKILDEYQTWWQNSINVGKGKLGIDVGYTRSVHHDIDTETVGQGNMAVNNIPFSVKYQVTGEHSGLKLITGVNGTYEFEHNLTAPPAPYVADYEIPNYTKFEAGGYAILEENYKNLTLSGGLRYDITNFIGKDMYLINAGAPGQAIVPAETPGAAVQFTGFNNTYTGWSGSLGASYQLPANNYIKLNISKSYRSPAINELTSNGLNIGSNAVQLGNINLKAEQGYQVDFAYGINGRDISFELDGFYNHINNFIFADRTDSISQGYPVYQYVSSNTAILTGASGYFNIHPGDAKWLEITNGLTYIYTHIPNSTDSTNHLPWIPAPHLTTQVKFKLNDRKNSILKGTFIEIGQTKYWEQNDVYSALYTELPSAGYTLYNAGLGTNFVNPKTGKVVCFFYLSCTNLTNTAYADHLNLAQYFYSKNGNLVTVTQQRQGVYNMGRNVGMKLIFPFGGHKVSDTEVHGID